ncbi:hypothetical protein G5S_0297 [Chlamydia pecorum E58]|uniref:Uncharacterized protein n=1 Tax=Chlamydia pecorum (strain ATCC VR-628 / DSM 29919 / E58) TaxID=331635 RepID=A0AA34RCX6_CHLPE|nr:hypothetical protein G5S_0297 [Chlamydia pecorum E58]
MFTRKLMISGHGKPRKLKNFATPPRKTELLLAKKSV